MPVASGVQSSEVNVGNTPSAPTGERNVAWQAGTPYDDPNNPGYQVRDVSAHTQNVGGDDPRSTTSETVGAASTGKCVTFSDASPAAPIAVSLDSTVGDTFTCSVLNKSTQTITLTPSSGDVDDGSGPASSKTLAAGTSCELFKTSSGSPAVAHWRMLKGAGSGGGSQPYIAATYIIGKPDANMVVLKHVFTRTVSFPTNMSGAKANAGTFPAGTITYTINKNGSSIGTLQITNAGVYTFSTSAASFSAGDRMTIVAPNPQDATLADVAITLEGTR